MYAHSLSECFTQIRLYQEGERTGFPLIVHTENYGDSQKILQQLGADGSKRILRVSEHTFANGLPNLLEVMDAMSQMGSFIVSGVSQALLLQGREALDEQIGELLRCSVRGTAVVILSHCRAYLEKYLQRDPRVARHILLLSGEASCLPYLRFAKLNETAWNEPNVKEIKGLLDYLEQISDEDVSANPVITVRTDFSKGLFKNSLYALLESGGAYGILAERFPDLASATRKEDGTEEEWSYLLNQTGNYRTFAAFVCARFGSTEGLDARLGEVFSANDEKLTWLYYLSLKAFGTGQNQYLKYVLASCGSYTKFLHCIYQGLLEISRKDINFESYYRERKLLLKQMPENLPELAFYCENVGRWGKDAAYYLTDRTEDEKYAFLKTIADYSWSEQELLDAVAHGFPELALYMKKFSFDERNTRLPERDGAFREALTNYFQSYKAQKIRNQIDGSFLAEVERNASERPFFKLQPRSAIVSAMDKNNVQAYFFDALGVEYLSYIQGKCEEYGLLLNVQIGRCELPSITVKNKEFKQFFETRDIGQLDELKHHSQVYNYETCKYPIHIFKELSIINQELLHIRATLLGKSVKRAVVLSDHGASRLAVLYGQENASTLELPEKGIHSGRCCPCEKDPGIAKAAFEDGYSVLGNYERFKGSRRANLEVHGGASLEEVVVPVLTISLKPTNIVYHFVESVLRYKIGKPPVIQLFCNVPMNKPKLSIEGTFYSGTLEGDGQYASFILTEIKRAREYKAEIYEDDNSTGVTLTFRVERNTKTKDLFG